MVLENTIKVYRKVITVTTKHIQNSTNGKVINRHQASQVTSGYRGMAVKMGFCESGSKKIMVFYHNSLQSIMSLQRGSLVPQQRVMAKQLSVQWGDGYAEPRLGEGGSAHPWSGCR